MYKCKVSPPIEFLMEMLNKAMEAFNFAAGVPGGRSMATPIFYYFGNFDSIYFYRFHDRTYGAAITSLLDNITSIQEQKWTLFNV